MLTPSDVVQRLAPPSQEPARKQTADLLFPKTQPTVGQNTMSPTKARLPPARATGYVGAIPTAPHLEPTPPITRASATGGVFGYPSGWPAGPWFVPAFWTAALAGAWLLRHLS
jgi:hypothetical protein